MDNGFSSAPIARSSVPDQVFAQLREAILTGAYRAGERLPPQRALAADFRVNMASVREALGRLEQLRLIEVRHGDGTRVLDWRRSGGLEALVLTAGVDPALVKDLFEARRLLLVEAARLAAERHSSGQAATLLELAGALADAVDDDTALLADWAFMAALVEASGNVIFQLILNSVRELYLPHAAAFAPLVAERGRLAGLYRQVAVAVSAGDGASGGSRDRGAGRRPGRPDARMSSGLESFLAAAPWPQRVGLRGLLALIRRPRGAVLLARLPTLEQAARSALLLGRYDDPAISRPLGWDATAVAARGRRLRRSEGRPEGRHLRRGRWRGGCCARRRAGRGRRAGGPARAGPGARPQ